MASVVVMDWRECCDKRIVKAVKIDEELIKSLVKSSRNKFASMEQLNLTEVTASSKVSLAYDSLRELLEALALENEFKIYNHECYTAFLKEILKKSDLGNEFDEIIKIRNAINYYGKYISIDDAKSVLIKIDNLKNDILILMMQK